jgi:hypothetical protein
MERFVAVVKQYPGQQQVDLAFEIEVPGSWFVFGAGPMGSLTATEQREKYKAQAVEYAEVHEFPGATKGARKTREKAIRFICITDATAEPNSEGYWMKLSQWNRYRNDTFKDRREDELAFIPGEAPATEGGVVEKLKAPQTPSIKTVFTLKSEGVHIQRNGTQVQCFWWACAHLLVGLRGRTWKQMSRCATVTTKRRRSRSRSRRRRRRRRTSTKMTMMRRGCWTPTRTRSRCRLTRPPTRNFLSPTVFSTTWASRTTRTSRVRSFLRMRSRASSRSKRVWASAWATKWPRC